jgi:hypothetical protein
MDEPLIPVGRIAAPATTGDVPHVLLVFTGLVFTGVMINATVVIPTATYYGTSLLSSAFIISTYSVGAMAGLALFRGVGRRSMRAAYLLHCFFMSLGNLAYWLFTRNDDSYAGVVASRLVVGLEGGCMYNAAVALVEVGSGAAAVRSRARA